MKIITTMFSYEKKNYDYSLMHDVFIKSCNAHCPDVEVITLFLEVSVVNDNKKPGCWTNTAKLREMVKCAETINDDIILADCDMLCTGDFRHAFDIDFDIAYTRKREDHNTSCVLNGGILFIKNNPVARDWLRSLLETNEKMYSDKSFHEYWKKKYYGQVQAAMGCMIESNHPARVYAYDTLTWNCVDIDWECFNDNTVFVHIKGRLRESILDHCGYEEHEKIMNEWYKYCENKSYTIKEKPIIRQKPKIVIHKRYAGVYNDKRRE